MSFIEINDKLINEEKIEHIERFRKQLLFVYGNSREVREFVTEAEATAEYQRLKARLIR